MRDETARLLAERALGGQRVAVVSPKARQAMPHILQCMGEDRVVRTHRGNGRERIEVPNGGRVLFLRDPSMLRGHVFDTVYLGEAAWLASERVLDAVTVATLTGTPGEMIRP